MKLIYTLAAVAVYILASVGASLLFRVASQHTGRMAFLYFVLGNCVGLCVSISMTLALRNANPNLIFAACLGGAFCALQLASTLIFKQPLAPIQWVGVSLVAAGLVLLPFK